MISRMLIHVSAHVDSLEFGYNSVPGVTPLSHGSRPESDEEACLQGGSQARGKEQAGSKWIQVEDLGIHMRGIRWEYVIHAHGCTNQFSGCSSLVQDFDLPAMVWFDGDVVTGSKSPQRRSQCRRSWIRQLFHPASEVMGTFGMTRWTSSIVVEI